MKARLLALLLCCAAAPAAAETVLLRGGKVHTVAAAGTLAQADVLLQDGRIAAIGARLAPPANAEVVDATGLVVTPGLFDAYTQLGLVEIHGVDETADYSSKDKRFGASLDVVDGLNPASVLIQVSRSEGLTRAVAAPLSGEHDGLFAGWGAVLNLGGYGGSVRALVQRPQAAMFVAAGEAAAQRVGGSRLAAFALLRESLEEARQPQRWMGRPNREPLLSPLEAAALKRVLDGRAPLVVSVQGAADIQALLALADEYRFRPVIQGGAEAHRLAADLAARGVPVVLDPLANLPDRFERVAARADSAAILHRAGVLIALSEGDSHNARNVRQLAGNAVAHGLPWDAALAAITRNPARIYGVDGAVGSIEVGKAADLVLWDGDPLEVTSFARRVFIDGRTVPLQNRQTLLRDRYLKRMQ